MKHIILLSTLAALIVSCQSEENPLSSYSSAGKKEIIITASLDNSIQTKTEHIDFEKVYWSPNDEIVVFSAGEATKFTSLNDAISKSAKFKGQISVVSGVNDDMEDSYIWGLYPYDESATLSGGIITTILPNNQVGAENTFADDLLITMGRSLNFSIPFHHVCSGLRFTVTKEGIKSITIKSNGDEPIAGKFSAGFNDNGKPTVSKIIDPASSVSVFAPNGETFKTGVWYYIITLPVTFNSGVTFTLNTDNESGTKVINSSFSLAQGFISTATDIDKGVTFSPINDNPDYEMPEMVDMGLSVKWATFNIGASSPEEQGDYFAWGETAPKDNYTWGTYKWCNGSGTTLTKYNNKSSYGADGITDNLRIIQLEDDIANQTFGGEWRIPTQDMFNELVDNCTLTWGKKNGRNGYSFKSKINGNSIFIPVTGLFEGSDIKDPDNAFRYWTANLSTSPNTATSVYATSSLSLTYTAITRYYGIPIRPVYGSTIPVNSISINKNSISLPVSSYCQLVASVSPSNATNKKFVWSSSKASVAKVSSDGLVTAVSEGTAIIKVTSKDGNKVSSCTVTVTNSDPVPNIVDLGLSVKWGSKNVGAVLPEDYGAYYAWGETEPKSSYLWNNYKWTTGTQYKYTKYNYDEQYGYTVDNKKVLESSDDVATQKYGGRWTIPTVAQIDELIAKCTWEYTSVNGVFGFKVISKTNGNSIFLPLAGYMSESGLVFDNLAGYYWSSSIATPALIPDGGNPMYACCITDLGEGYIHRDGRFRSLGLAIRPVYK